MYYLFLLTTIIVSEAGHVRENLHKKFIDLSALIKIVQQNVP